MLTMQTSAPLPPILEIENVYLSGAQIMEVLLGEVARPFARPRGCSLAALLLTCPLTHSHISLSTRICVCWSANLCTRLPAR